MKQIADDYIVIPRGTETLDFNGTAVFNETGAYLWNILLDYTETDVLVNALVEKYAIEPELAKNDVEKFLTKMIDENMVEIQ